MGHGACSVRIFLEVFQVLYNDVGHQISVDQPNAAFSTQWSFLMSNILSKSWYKVAMRLQDLIMSSVSSRNFLMSSSCTLSSTYVQNLSAKLLIDITEVRLTPASKLVAVWWCLLLLSVNWTCNCSQSALILLCIITMLSSMNCGLVIISLFNGFLYVLQVSYQDVLCVGKITSAQHSADLHHHHIQEFQLDSNDVCLEARSSFVCLQQMHDEGASDDSGLLPGL